MEYDYYTEPKGCEHRLIKFILVILLLYSCGKESPHAWIGHIQQRYVNDHNVVVTHYQRDIVFPIEMGLTQRQIYIFEEANKTIIDENREIGDMIKWQELK